MRQALNGLYRLSGWAAAMFIVAICGVVSVQVAFNLTDKIAGAVTDSAIGLTIPSYGDFTGFFLASATFLALAYTLREGGHIRVTLFISHLSAPVRRVVELWCVGIAAAMSGYFAWYAALLVHESYVFNDLSPGMIPVPIWIPQTGMLIGLMVLTVALVDELITLVRGEEASYAGKGENLLEGDEVSSEDWLATPKTEAS